MNKALAHRGVLLLVVALIVALVQDRPAAEIASALTHGRG